MIGIILLMLLTFFVFSVILSVPSMIKRNFPYWFIMFLLILSMIFLFICVGIAQHYGWVEYNPTNMTEVGC